MNTLPDSVPGSTSWLRAALAGSRSPRAARLSRVVTLGAAAYEIGKKAHGHARGRIEYTVAVPGDDEVYDALHAWLVTQVPSKRRRSITALTARRGHDQPTIVSEGRERVVVPQVRQVYDGSNAQTVIVAGHRVTVKVESHSKLPANVILSMSDSGWYRGAFRIVFTCHGEAARDAVLGLIGQIAAQGRGPNPAPRMHIARRWGGWSRITDAPARSLDTVILAAGQQERIVGDLEQFLGDETTYARIGLPWHRGYLFEGPPGTGKTSMAKAIARHFNLDVYYVPLSDIAADTDLLALLGEVEPRSLLVLEDIDVVHASKSRDDAENKAGISLSGLLNALDGFVTPNGLVTVMTTNDASVLDAALIRAGRADVRETFGYLDDDQALRVGRLVGDSDAGHGRVRIFPPLEGARLTHADLIEAAKPHLHDGVAAWYAMAKRIETACLGASIEADHARMERASAANA